MMTSESRTHPPEAFVWVWLPAASSPVVAARLTDYGTAVGFVYGRSYLARSDAIALSLPDLPLRPGETSTGDVPGCVADAAPESWGRRVIERRQGVAAGGLSTLGYLLESSSDRIGALDVQHDPDTYRPRVGDDVPIEDLAEAAQRVEEGLPLSEPLRRALLHSTAPGGARPKALIAGGGGGRIAKFPSATDTSPVTQSEFVAMTLARHAGLEVASVSLQSIAAKHVLLVDRFDRTPEGGRRFVVSARTVLASGRRRPSAWESYPLLVEDIRARFAEPTQQMRELFARITFNILCANTDDHPQNHAAFWDGETLTLTPAFDVCPQLAFGAGAEQTMAYGPNGDRASQVARLLAHAPTYRLTAPEATAIVDHQIDTILDHWHATCDQAELTRAQRDALWGHQFLNPHALTNYTTSPRPAPPGPDV